jgi:hypothetical protein
LDLDDDEVTDEEDPESQESHGWLESGKTPAQDQPKSNEAGPSDYQGKRKGNGSTVVLDEVVTTDLEISVTKNRDIQHYEAMCESSEVMKVSEAIPTSQGQTDSLNSGIMDVAMSQADLSNDNTIHDYQIVMGVSDIFQEMNDMAIKLNPTQQEVSAKKVVNSHLFVPMKNASGLATGNLSPRTPNESTLELASLNSAVNQEVDYKMCVTVEEKEDDLVKSAVNQEVDYHMCVTVEE